MTIYIGNTTRQEQEIHVRLPEVSRIFVYRISSGKQIDVKGLTGAQEDALVDYIAKFGAISRANLHGKINEFSGLVYDTKKPINMDEFNYGHEDIIDKAESRSVMEATRSALAAAEVMKDRSKGNEMTATSVEVEVAEEHPDRKAARKRNMRITIDKSVNGGDELPIH